MGIMKRSHLGSVIEFRLPDYFVYGVVIEENPNIGDTLVMYAPKYKSPIRQISDLIDIPVRYNILFFAKLAASRKNRDLMKILGKLDIAQLPVVDKRFRLSLAGLSKDGKWQIIQGDIRKAIEVLTPDLALLSEGELPNLEAIREFYDLDYYPWSAALTSRGAVSFDPSEFESEQRRALIKH